MAATASARALMAAAIFAVQLVGLGSDRAAAVDEVPAERVEAIPGGSVAAMVADVNGDGERELVRLTAWETNPGLQAVEVIAMQGTVASSRGQVPLQRAASVDDHAAGNNPGEEALLPLGADEPARLIAWRSGAIERVLVATMQGSPGSAMIERSCCMTLWRVTLDEDGGTRLRLIQNTSTSAAWIVAADMDADGTDELAVVETPDPAQPNATRTLVMRWNGRDFDQLRAEAEEGLIEGPLTPLGDSDGHAGDEVGYTTPPGSFDQVVPTLHRIALVGDRLRLDSTELPVAGTVVAIPGPRGGRLAVVASDGVELLRWPAGKPDAVSEASSNRGGEVLGVLGKGSTVRLLVLRGGAVDVLDSSLTSRQGIAGGPTAAWFAASSWPPYHGELPGGDQSGVDALLFGGRMAVAPSSSSNQAALRDVAVLAGRVPVGLFGPGRGWTAVTDGVALPVGRRGGSLTGVARSASVAVVRTESVMQAEADEGLLQPPLEGALLDGRRPARPVILTSAGVQASIVAPPGTEALASGQVGGITSAVVGLQGVASITLVRDDPDATEDDRFTARLLVVTPAGHGYGAIWEVRVMRRPPGLTATAPMAPLSFSVPLSGRTEPTASLVVDGAPVRLQSDGTFLAEVNAGPLPRAVRLEATDPVGNTTELVLEVVGVLDYRRLPWIPIVAGLTLLAGALLYLRAPRPGSPSAEHPDEGMLEEIQ